MFGASKTTKDIQPRAILAKPLDSLVFLLPLILFCEVAALAIDTTGIRVTEDRVVAYQLLQIFFNLFGVGGTLMPGLAVVAILLATHFASRQPWRIERRSVLWMYVESLAWAAPLLAMNQFTRMTATQWPVDSWLTGAALCIGAGIYEELVFRLALISLIVIVGADLLRFSQGSTLVAATLVSAMLFALHHHPPFGAEPFNAFRFTFRALAGVYLGTIFVFRGYGPAAGAHIAYNLLIVGLFS